MKITSIRICAFVTVALSLLAGTSFAAVKLVSFSPAAGATNVCIDTQLHLTFDGPPVLAKSGVIQIIDNAGAVVDSIDVNVLTRYKIADINVPTHSKIIGGMDNFKYYPVLIKGNEAVIAFKNSILAYGKTYEVKVPTGLFVDKDGSAANLDAVKTWKFSTKPAAPKLPAEGPRRITVAADGTGDFATVQGALDFVPAGNTAPTTIFLRKGTYNEIVYVTNKHNLTIWGEDRKGTIIAYPDNQGLNNTDRTMMPGGYRRGMLRAVDCNDLTITRLTLHNTTQQGGGQAESIILNGGANNAHAIVTDVDMISHQDTLQINGQAYVSNCYIEGDTDFMWGTGPCFFENCQLRAVRNKSMFTQIRNPPTNHGYVYKNCTFEGGPGITGCLLSRVLQTRFPASEVVLLDCTLTSVVNPVGWSLQGPGQAPNVHYWEYNSRDPNGKPIDDSKRLAVSKRLTKEADAETIANYSNPAWVLGNNWNPKLAPIFTNQPAPKSADSALVTQHPALFLVGDSIMKTGTGTGDTGPWGYGSELVTMFDPAKIHVYNEGRGGRSSRGYIEEGLWKDVLARMQPGDWVLIDFGHNDAANSQNYPDRISGKGSGDEMSDVDAPGGKKSVHSYGWYLKQYVKDAAGKGAKVVILSPAPRNRWTDGKIQRGFDGYAQWAAEAAQASGASFIDLNALAADRFDALGQPTAAQIFNDTQHTKKMGARINAESVVAGLKQLKDCPLASCLAAQPTEKKP